MPLSNIPSPVMKLLKIILISLIVYLLAFGIAMAQDQIAVPLSNPAQPSELSVELVRGSVTVRGYQGQEILIHTQALGKQNEALTSRNGMRRITSRGYDLEATEDDNRVRVKVRTPNKRVDLTIQVPTRCSVSARTVNDGHLRIEDVQGEIEATNVNGHIFLENISGSAVANTVNGRLEASFTRVTPDTPMAFTSLNGNVDVTFPATTKMTLKMKTLNGEIYTDFDLKISSEGTVVKSEQGSVYRIKVNNQIIGDINGGGPTVQLKNHNGNIYVRKK